MTLIVDVDSKFNIAEEEVSHFGLVVKHAALIPWGRVTLGDAIPFDEADSIDDTSKEPTRKKHTQNQIPMTLKRSIKTEKFIKLSHLWEYYLYLPLYRPSITTQNKISYAKRHNYVSV